MPSLPALATVALMVAVSSPLPAADAGAPRLRLGDGGIEIDAGSMGQFTLGYPAPGPASDKPLALVEKQVTGNQALLKYAGGGQIALTLAADGTVTLRTSALPGDTRQIRMDMLIDFNLSQGGSWQAGGQDEKPFPAERQATAFLYQANNDRMTLRSNEGRTLVLTVPPWSWMQLQDNREWGWKIFALWFSMPYTATTSEYRVQITGAAGGARKVQVDRFGQTTQRDYAGKVGSLEELMGDEAREGEWLASLTPPETDPYGGQPGSGAALGLRQTGFFHLEQKGERWYLVDPAGNAFFQLGICSFGPCDDYTYLPGREAIYEWIPPTGGEFGSAYRPGDPTAFSYHLANRIRKTGRPFDINEHVRAMIPRVRKWGFNSVGAFSPTGLPAHKEASFPYVGHLPFSVWEGVPELPGIGGTWDPFDEATRRRVEQLLAERIAPNADDPLMIGYFLANEPLYEDIPKVVPTLGGKYACKRRLVEMLRGKYGSIEAFGEAWGLPAESFEELLDRGLEVSTRQASEDVKEFTGLFLDEYYRFVSETFRRCDPNHLLIGSRLQAGTINNEQLCRISARYMDLISFNYYTYFLDKDFLNRIYGWTGGKPMILSEFYYNSPRDSGLPGGGKDVSSQEERGLGYRNYVEQAASLGYVVGIEWFSLVDQSLTGRFFSKYNGENGNNGLISVADRPWRVMLEQMMATNYGIYEVVSGARQPFVFADPRFAPSGVSNQVLKIARATGPITLNGTAENWPGTPAEQISSKRLVQGATSGGVECAFKLCWDDTHLYLLANVDDPTPMLNTHTGADLWLGDGIELFTGAEGLEQGGGLLFGDRQVLLSAGTVDGRHPSYIARGPRQVPCEVFVAPRVDGGGYTLEAAIPFEALGFEPREGLELRFDMGIDDSEDGSSRARQLMWNGTDRNSGDRTGWGRAVLVR